MKKFLSNNHKACLTLAFGLLVFCFWRYRYPFALAFQEQLQLFLFDGDYFLERMAEPGGLARYVAEFLVQFYNNFTAGAAIIAVLMMTVQRLTWRVMGMKQAEKVADCWYPLSFVPASILWFAMGDESVLLTYTVALVLALTVMAGWTAVGTLNRYVRWGIVLVAVPLLYWFIGPMVLLVALWVMPLSVIYAVALMILSAHAVPFPMMRVMSGIDYYRFPQMVPYVLILIPVAVLLLGYGARYLPKPRSWMMWPALVLLVALMLVPKYNFEDKKYELIEYDYLVRINDWDAVIAKAEKQMPDLPMSVSATNLALAMSNQLGERAFDFYQHGTEGLLPNFDRNFSTLQLTGEIFFRLGLVNTAQRFAFEAMEAIPNYNKSVRAVKRLAETNLVNGQYRVAEKYLRMLEKTIFYRPWAQRTIQLLGDEKAIDSHPLYGTLRQYRLQEDFLFSDRELDKICGRLFMHNQQNGMALQYLLMMPLLDKDIPRFMAYLQLVQGRVRYNPRSCQEATALAFMQQRREPPKGLVSPWVLQQMTDFSRIYAHDRKSPELERFRNTVWYYFMGK